MFKRAVAIDEKTLGANASDTVTAVSELAELYGKQNKFAEAEPLYVRIVAAKEKRDSHGLSMASVLSAQAGNYSKESKFAEAQAAYERALAIREKVQGAENKDVATVLEGLSQSLVKQDKFAEAEPLARRLPGHS